MTYGAESCTDMPYCTVTYTGKHAVKNTHWFTGAHVQHTAYIIPPSERARPWVPCLFVLYLVPSAIWCPRPSVSHSAAGPNSLLFSGLGSRCPNKERTDKHRRGLEFMMKVSEPGLTCGFTGPLSLQLCTSVMCIIRRIPVSVPRIFPAAW